MSFSDILKVILTVFLIAAFAVVALVGWACLIVAKDADGPSNRLLESHDDPGDMIV